MQQSTATSLASSMKKLPILPLSIPRRESSGSRRRTEKWRARWPTCRREGKHTRTKRGQRQRKEATENHKRLSPRNEQTVAHLPTVLNKQPTLATTTTPSPSFAQHNPRDNLCFCSAFCLFFFSLFRWVLFDWRFIFQLGASGNNGIDTLGKRLLVWQTPFFRRWFFCRSSFLFVLSSTL